MGEALADATYRGFNYPHQIAVWLGLGLGLGLG